MTTKHLGTDYIGMAYNYFKLVQNCIGEMEAQGNKTLIISKAEDVVDDGWAEYETKTRWNDMNIGIPVLFSFFHGVELMLKGLILNCGGELPTNRRNHGLTSLLTYLKDLEGTPSQGVLSALESCLRDNSFQSFFTANNKSADHFYELLKYPESKNGDSFDFRNVRGREEEGLLDFQKVKELSENIRKAIVEWKASSRVEVNLSKPEAS